MRDLHILSIDIDYILEPCINLYEKHLTQGHPFFVSYVEMLDHPADVLAHWRDLAPLINKAGEISQQNYLDVIDLYSKALFGLKKSESDKLYFADNHDTILTPLQNMYQEGDKFNIINLDHHHDIYYNISQMQNVDLYNLASPADWVWYLEKNNLLKTYYWIGNDNSEDFKPIQKKKPVGISNTGFFKSLKEFREDETRMPKKFDLIYVCKSPQWTPTKFYSYFENLKHLAENYFKKEFKQDTGFFCGGRVSKNFFKEPEKSLVLDKKFYKGKDDT